MNYQKSSYSDPLTVNQGVLGSSPSWGAKQVRHLHTKCRCLFFNGPVLGQLLEEIEPISPSFQFTKDRSNKFHKWSLFDLRYCLS